MDTNTNFQAMIEHIMSGIIQDPAADKADHETLCNKLIRGVRWHGLGDDSCCPCNDDDAELIECNCEVCRAGGSCIQPPFGTTIGELVGKMVEQGAASASPANRCIATNPDSPDESNVW